MMTIEVGKYMIVVNGLGDNIQMLTHARDHRLIVLTSRGGLMSPSLALLITLVRRTTLPL